MCSRVRRGSFVYEHEPELLDRLWFPVARAQDVEAAPVAATLMGENLVVARGAEGLVVATDRCPHRGVRLSLGSVHDGEIECAYHGWRYATDGRCTLVPSQPGAQPAARLQVRPVIERFGLIWATLGEPLFEPPAIPEMAMGDGWEVGQGEPFDVACGLRSITENFRDSSHFAFVHRRTFGDVSPLIPAYEVEREGWNLAWDLVVTFGYPAPADDDPADPEGTAGSKYRFGETTEGDGGQLLHYRFRLPSLSYVYTEHPGGGRRMVCQVAAPLTRDATRSRAFWFVAADRAFRDAFGPIGDQVDIERVVFAEDVPIVEALDPVEAPLELEGQAHVRADRYSVAYRRLYRELLDWFAATQEGARAGTPVTTAGRDG